MLKDAPGSKRRGFISRHWLILLVIAGLLFLLSTLSPGVTWYWSYISYSILFQELGLGRHFADFLSVIVAFVYCLAIPYAFVWMLTGRRRLHGLIGLLVVFGTGPLLHILLSPNFNQQTGSAEKWYVLRPDGQMSLFDSGGFDPVSGLEKRRLTQEAVRAIERQKRGAHAHRLTEDPRSLQYFNANTGQPLVWYHKDAFGLYSLFDAEGFDPQSGDLLQPITAQVAADVVKIWEERDRQAEALRRAETQAREKAVIERQEAEKRQAAIAAADRQRAEEERTSRALIDLFGAKAFQSQSVLLGVRASVENGQAPASRILSEKISVFLAKKGIPSEELRAEVYQTPFVDRLMEGDGSILRQIGLTDKMRVAVFVTARGVCRKGGVVPVSCSVTTQIRIVKPDLSSALLGGATEIGAGINESDAISRAADLLLNRHPDLFDRI